MTLEIQNAPGSMKTVWTGRVLTLLSVLFLVMDSLMKVFKAKLAVDATKDLGYPESTVVWIGVVLLVCTIVYALGQTSVLGAVLLTGYLGGAIASNVRASTPVFNIIFPLIIAAMIWGGLLLRCGKTRQVMPLRR